MPKQKQKKASRSTKMVRRSKSPSKSKSKTRSKIVVRKASPSRRNAAPKRRQEPKSEPATETEPERMPFGERVQEMDGSHVAVGVGAGALGNMLGVLVVGRGWIGPKTTAGLLLGGGALASTAGYFWDSDHLMAAGAGLATAGTFSLANQYAIDAYEAVEERAKKKHDERERKDLQKRLAEARVIVEAESKAKRNSQPRLVVIDQSGHQSEIDDDTDDADLDDDNYREDLAA